MFKWEFSRKYSIIWYAAYLYQIYTFNRHHIETCRLRTFRWDFVGISDFNCFGRIAAVISEKRVKYDIDLMLQWIFQRIYFFEFLQNLWFRFSLELKRHFHIINIYIFSVTSIYIIQVISKPISLHKKINRRQDKKIRSKFF